MTCDASYLRAPSPYAQHSTPAPAIGCSREAGHDGSHYGTDADTCAVWDSTMCIEADVHSHRFWVPQPTAQEAFDTIYG